MRHLDWYLAFGDYCILNDAFAGPRETEHSLLPMFEKVKNRSTKMSQFIKDVPCRRNNSKSRKTTRKSKLDNHRIQLPDGVCANSLRRGCIDHLTAKMPLLLAIFTTGHSIREKVGNIMEYVVRISFLVYRITLIDHNHL